MLIHKDYLHLAHRFLSKIQFPNNQSPDDIDLSKVDTEGCWLWTASVRGQHGYGGFKGKDRQEMAHRQSYLMFIGEIPAGVQVCHRCDTPLCVNPKHLFLGSQKDNQEDMVRKERQCKGDNHWQRRNPDKAMSHVKRINEIKMLRGSQAKGEKVFLAKLNPKKVQAIRLLYECGFSQREIAQFFGMSRSPVAQIISRQTWKHVK